MTRIDNLNDLTPWRAIWKAIDDLNQKNDLQHAAIGRGGITVYGGGVITIENGGLNVTGYAQITGELRGDGTLIWTGPWAFTGAGEITGNVDLTGNLDVVDDGNITIGNILIEDGKIYVGTGASQIVIDGATGKITAGNMSMDPTVSGGALTFANGAQVFTDDNTVQLYKGNSVIQVSNAYARLQNGGNVIEVNDGRARISSGAIEPADPGEDVAALGISSGGWLRRLPTIDGAS
ncbi:hypothetical protein [Microbacterium sp. S1037]|uniref:hypothetical protein n=1 Tax=Microbacterium sp. S1037 TaxID=3398227 RepID=UPI003AAEB2E0